MLPFHQVSDDPKVYLVDTPGKVFICSRDGTHWCACMVYYTQGCSEL